MSGHPVVDLAPAVLTATGVTKAFGATQALKGVDLTVRTGEIHALLGGNGSGKSTLVKILAGVYRADSGSIERLGHRHPLAEWTPARARHAGLHFVHQDPAIFGGLTVAENLFLGRGFETGGPGRISWSRTLRRTREVLDRFELDFAVDAPASTLRPADRTMLAIARALQDDGAIGGSASILVLDEPTASLPSHEVDVLLSSLEGLASRGGTILYISHRLPEILAVASHATVLRDGHLAAGRSLHGATEDDLIEMIVGRQISTSRVAPAGRPADRGSSDPQVAIRNLSVGGLVDLSFDVHAGEIVGIAGLLGAGRSSLLRAIFGALPRSTGDITVAGVVVNPKSPRHAMQAGIGFVPEDRSKDALFPTMSVRENLSATVLRRYWRGFHLRHAAEKRDAVKLVGIYGVTPARDDTSAGALSGGNAQKIVIARWLRTRPRLLLLDEPTQGVDVGARAAIHEQIRAAAAVGLAAIVVSSDFAELASLCDRILVLRCGHIVDEIVSPVDDHHLTEICLTSNHGAS